MMGDRIVQQYVPDLIGQVANDAYSALVVQGFYDYGHYAEICNQLMIKDQGMSEQVRTKYPLTWLVMDFSEDFGKSLDTYCEVSCQLIIACNTEKDYTMEQRRDLIFLPTLYPIYTELLYQFSQSSVFRMPSIQKIQHTKIDRPYWGGQDSGNGDKNLFNDFIDAIQIKNLKLSISKKFIAC